MSSPCCLCHSFLMVNVQNVEERMRKDFNETGETVMKGSLTTFLGIFFFYGAGSAVFRSMFVIFATVILLSILHVFFLRPFILTLCPSLVQPLEGLESDNLSESIKAMRLKS